MHFPVYFQICDVINQDFLSNDVQCFSDSQWFWQRIRNSATDFICHLPQQQRGDEETPCWRIPQDGVEKWREAIQHARWTSVDLKMHVNLNYNIVTSVPHSHFLLHWVCISVIFLLIMPFRPVFLLLFYFSSISMNSVTSLNMVLIWSFLACFITIRNTV